MNLNVQEYELFSNIAGGCLTNSKHPDRFVHGVYPKVIGSAKNSHVWDLNGTKYLDFICGLGTNLFGYQNQLIKQFVDSHNTMGACHSLPTKWEIIVARMLRDILPFIEKTKFVDSGSSGCEAAIRIARSYQQYTHGHLKKIILTECYHGWHSEFAAKTDGTVEQEYIFDISAIDNINPKKVAAIIVEPVNLTYDKIRLQRLKSLFNYCERNKVLMIFDETITALRFPKFCVANYFNLRPDLIIFGKALANGEKISAVCGMASVMEADYFVSGTYHGHVPTLITAARCLELITKSKVYDINLLFDQGTEFLKQINSKLDSNLNLVGYGTRSAFVGDDIVKGLFFQEMCKAGYLLGSSFFFNFDHVKYMDEFLYTVDIVMQKIHRGEVRLQGSVPTGAFASKKRS